MTKKKWSVVRTPKFEDDMKKLSPEDRAKVEEAIQKIAEDPYVGEPSKPCPNCGEYFFHSDGKCPFCSHVLKFLHRENRTHRGKKT